MPSNPPPPGTCCCSVFLQLAVTVQVPPLCTTAIQCTEPSELHDRVTLGIDRLQTSQVPGVTVLVGVPPTVVGVALGGTGVLVNVRVGPTGVLLGVLVNVRVGGTAVLLGV